MKQSYFKNDMTAYIKRYLKSNSIDTNVIKASVNKIEYASTLKPSVAIPLISRYFANRLNDEILLSKINALERQLNSVDNANDISLEK